ncbi:MAG: acetyl-coenzyme A synthetase, partial [Methylococcales bacterium]|nr:acetyl-coenzyme A synthetase [Methylococcales bacterium]
MSEKIYPVKSEISQHTYFSKETYQTLYQHSIDDPEAFWSEQAKKFLDWSKPWDKTLEFDYPRGEISWFKGGKLNVSVN